MTARARIHLWVDFDHDAASDLFDGGPGAADALKAAIKAIRTAGGTVIDAHGTVSPLAMLPATPQESNGEAPEDPATTTRSPGPLAAIRTPYAPGGDPSAPWRNPRVDAGEVVPTGAKRLIQEPLGFELGDW